MDWKARFQETYSELHASEDTCKEVMNMARKEQNGRQKKSSFKYRTAVLVAAAVFAVGTITAAAVGSGWSWGMSDKMQADEQTRARAEETGLATFPDLSVTKGGVTMTLNQCVVDQYSAYAAFKVTGYDLPEGKEPSFGEWNVDVGGDYSACGGRFYNGMIIGPSGNSVYADGSSAGEGGDYTGHYVASDGSLEYDMELNVSETEGNAPLPGRKIKVTFQGLGTFNKEMEPVVDVDETFEFEWTLTGSKDVYRAEDLSAPVGDSGAVVNRVRLSPISVKVDMDFPRQTYTETGIDEDGKEYELTDYVTAPYLVGFELEDGTRLFYVTEGGIDGFTGKTGTAYVQEFQLGRIIEPEHVKSLLFIKGEVDEGQPLTDENLYIVPIR